VAGEDVVDDFASSAVDACEGVLWQQRGEVPEPVAVALIGSVESDRAELGSGWSMENLGGRCGWFVV